MHQKCSTTAKFQISIKSQEFYLIYIVTQYLRSKSPYKTRASILIPSANPDTKEDSRI